ncbi:MAG TPA: glycerate kinase, partial [Ignavibacteria bacterium]|nr:glycerate kinase [Ignavibacteria bacterium]
MTKKILIAPNSYKECADSITAADFFSKYLKIDENYIIVKRPVSDGGDGFLKVCQNRFNLKILKYQITTPYDNSTFSCSIGYSETGKQIFIESAEVLGLKIIPKEKRHPISLSSIGMGELIKLIMEDVETGKIEVEKIIIG